MTSAASGSFPAGTTLYSASADANVTGHINVHALSDFVVRSYYSAGGVNPDSAFANPLAAGNAAPTPLAFRTMADAVIKGMLALWFDKAGITVSLGSAGKRFDQLNLQYVYGE